MPLASSFAAQLAVSPPVTNPFTFGTTVLQWVESLAMSYIDTPEKRSAIVEELMKVYDATGLAVGKSNAVLGSLFPLMRGSVQAAIVATLAYFADKPPEPADVVPIPTGSAAP